MRLALVLALGAGCGFHIPGGTAAGDAAPDDANPDTPIDMSPNMPDMAIDMMPLPQDQDGDTILDTVDNCVAVANTDQRNHDGDPFGDACDRCPHLASASDPDGDGDGVGDACDPRPANNADQRKFWFGFYDMNEINGWTMQGTWTVSSQGYLVQATKNLSGIAPPGNVNVPFVMTEIVIDDPNTSFEIGISDQVIGTAYECALVKANTNVTIRARDATAPGGSGTTSLSWPGTAGIGSTVQLTLDLGSDIDCRAVQGATTIRPVESSNGDPTGRTYVGTVGAATRFDYLFVVDQEP